MYIKQHIYFISITIVATFISLRHCILNNTFQMIYIIIINSVIYNVYLYICNLLKCKLIIIAILLLLSWFSIFFQIYKE